MLKQRTTTKFNQLANIHFHQILTFNYNILLDSPSDWGREKLVVYFSFHYIVYTSIYQFPHVGFKIKDLDEGVTGNTG